VGTISGKAVTGVLVKVSSEQITAVVSLIIGSGFTVTVTVKVSVQTSGAEPEEAVTV
jgi:hypothetical protein